MHDRLILVERQSTVMLGAIWPAVFTAMAVFLILNGRPEGWLPLIIGVLASVVAVDQIIRPPSLTLTPQGFAISLIGHRERVRRWDEVSQFSLKRQGVYGFFRRRVSFDLVTDDVAVVRSAGSKSRSLHSNYGQKPTELVKILNYWRTR